VFFFEENLLHVMVVLIITGEMHLKWNLVCVIFLINLCFGTKMYSCITCLLGTNVF